MRIAAGADQRSIATEASTLRSISKTLHPGLLASKRTQISRGSWETPYTHDEISHLFAATTSLATKPRRRYGRSILALGLATGPFGGEFAGVKPTDVRRVDGQLIVTLRRAASGRSRQVTVLPEYAELLEIAVAAAVAAGDRYLIGGSGSSRNRLNKVLEDLGVSHWPVPLVHGRLRTTYLVGLTSQRHSVPELLDQAGITTLAALDRILPYLDVNDHAEHDEEQYEEQDEEQDQEQDQEHDEHDDEQDDEEDHRWGVAS